MTRTLAALILSLAAAPALAETQLDRMERVSEALQVRMLTALLPDTDMDVAEALAWDDAMRDAGACVLDAYAAESSPERMDETLDAMEAMLDAPPPASVDDMTAQMESIPTPVSQDRAIEINRSCGMVDLQMQRMMESGLMREMMQADLAR